MTEAPPNGYATSDVEQHILGVPASGGEVDPRSAFMHDLDRVKYSSAFASLAGKTQVVASIEMGGFHTRLTHTLKVAQLGRRIAEMLVPPAAAGPDPDLVEAACLAHDIGHPPFGHAGESALSATYKELAVKRDPTSVEGFEGNAQNLRILSFLAVRSNTSRGLNLTRAALDATTKYPWERAATSVGTTSMAEAEDSLPVPSTVDTSTKFGIYAEDRDTAFWMLQGAVLGARPAEEEIMDWADEVTYACHDVEDFYRAGLIPLEILLNLRGGPRDRASIVESVELTDFLNSVDEKWTKKRREFDRKAVLECLFVMGNLAMIPGAYTGTLFDKGLVSQMTSRWISYFLGGLELRTTDANEDGALTRYGASLYVPPERKLASAILSELIWYYVINRPELASQQHGQSHIVSCLLRWHCEEWERLLPPDRKEEIDEHHNPLRAACDHVASLTERQALTLFHRMSGVAIGSLTERIR